MPEVTSKRFNDIKSSVVSGLSWTVARNTNLHIDSRVLKRGKKILAYKQRIPLERDTIMVFADKAPRCNWAHPCSYLLHDARNGELYQEVDAQFPPYMTVKEPKTYKPFHQPIHMPKAEKYYPTLPELRSPIRWSKQNRYAVLFSGASDNRHTNDLEFLYRTLRDIYGFSASNIYVLNYDGSVDYNGDPKPVANWPGDDTAYRMPVNGKGTKAGLDSVLDTLKAKLKKSDLLFIHTNNHGGHNGTESYLCTHSGADYMASDFAVKLGTLPEYQCLMVMMEQCHSGGFNSPILTHSTAALTSVSSACEELRSSIGGAEFDPFARDWIAAMTGNTPYGGALASNPDTDGSGKVSAEESHNYADAVKDPYDTPVYSESSTAAGKCYLGRRNPYFPRLMIEKLYPYYLRKPIPEFYEILHTRLAPQLSAIESRLKRTSIRQERQLSEELGEITKRAMRRR